MRAAARVLARLEPRTSALRLALSLLRRAARLQRSHLRLLLRLRQLALQRAAPRARRRARALASLHRRGGGLGVLLEGEALLGALRPLVRQLAAPNRGDGPQRRGREERGGGEGRRKAMEGRVMRC